MEKLTVLVVDDDREIVESIAIFLQADGYLVRKAYNGLEALDIVMTENVHLIILDIMMPELDGIKTLLKVRESKNLPIILLSAKSEDADKILGLTAGADDYITKPFNPSELVARVKSQLRRYTQLGAMQIKETQIAIRGLDESAPVDEGNGDRNSCNCAGLDRLRKRAVVCAGYAVYAVAYGTRNAHEQRLCLRMG